MIHARPRRLRAVRADEVRAGDVLWSDASNRRLVVVAASREQLRADGNIYADPEEPYDGPTAEAIVLLVIDEKRGELQRLGGYAPRARLQVVAQPRPRVA
jgi:hypothetical protein